MAHFLPNLQHTTLDPIYMNLFEVHYITNDLSDEEKNVLQHANKDNAKNIFHYRKINQKRSQNKT